jgi:hypothetical protein
MTDVGNGPKGSSDCVYGVVHVNYICLDHLFILRAAMNINEEKNGLLLAESLQCRTT